MKFATILAACLIAVTAARFDNQFGIRQLSEMVPTWTDKIQLQILADDLDTPRSQIQSQINEIVAQQSDDIQQAYRLLQQHQQTRQQQELQRQLERLQNENAPQDRINAVQQKHEIMTNMSLSQSEADEQIRQLYIAGRH